MSISYATRLAATPIHWKGKKRFSYYPPHLFLETSCLPCSSAFLPI